MAGQAGRLLRFARNDIVIFVSNRLRCYNSIEMGNRVHKSKRRALVAPLFALAVMLPSAWAASSCWPKGPPREPTPVTIGVPPNEQSGLIFIAEDQDFFRKNGLKVTIRIYDSALAALEGMKKGEVDVSQSAEFPIVTEAFKGEPITVIGSIDRFQNIFLVGRKDRGLANISDLKGKRIGAAPRTLTEFFLGRFLTLNGISLQDVTIVNMRFAESADALASGAVDAFQVQNRDIPLIRERLGDNIVVWESQSSQPGYEVISGRKDWVAGHQELITGLLKSLIEAEEYYASHPGEARTAIQKKLNFNDAYMATVTPSQHTYSLALDQSMVLAMEDEARWMIKNGLTPERQVPDFLNYIHEDGLKGVRPGAVNIIR
ncbi:MAG: NrtA/SsuA/CpmA family ABC transporter substrate-binding protein [Chloroflexi bacterium]|nr:NrtA/SsuA/CpmA family ABC transporter substrate-binding protein [Chloroflexota bacterium]